MIHSNPTYSNKYLIRDEAFSLALNVLLVLQHSYLSNDANAQDGRLNAQPPTSALQHGSAKVAVSDTHHRPSSNLFLVGKAQRPSKANRVNLWGNLFETDYSQCNGRGPEISSVRVCNDIVLSCF